MVIPSPAVLPEVLRRLATLGFYHHHGDLGMPRHEAFARAEVDEEPRDDTGRRWPTHQLAICAADGADLHRHLQFRDWLRSHPDRAAEYGRLKVHLAPLEGEARAGAAAVKTAFIEAALSAAGSG